MSTRTLSRLTAPGLFPGAGGIQPSSDQAVTVVVEYPQRRQPARVEQLRVPVLLHATTHVHWPTTEGEILRHRFPRAYQIFKDRSAAGELLMGSFLACPDVMEDTSRPWSFLQAAPPHLGQYWLCSLVVSDRWPKDCQPSPEWTEEVLHWTEKSLRDALAWLQKSLPSRGYPGRIHVHSPVLNAQFKVPWEETSPLLARISREFDIDWTVYGEPLLESGR